MGKEDALKQSQAIIDKYKAMDETSKQGEAQQVRQEETTEVVESAVQQPQVTPQPVQQVIAEPVQAPTPDVNAQLQEEMRKLSARFTTLQGKYDAEVPRLSRRNAQLESQCLELQKQLEDERASKIETLYNQKVDPVQILGEEQVEILGSDYVNGMQTVSEKNAKLEADRLRAEFQQQFDDIKRATQQQQLIAYESAVMSEVPEFKRLVEDEQGNLDYGFEQYLRSNYILDPFLSADSNMDVIVVADICKRYLNTIKQPVVPPQVPLVNPKEQAVAPRTSQSTIQPQVVTAKFNVSDYKAMQEKLTHHQISDKEFYAFLADFKQAETEGRVNFSR